MNQADVTGPFRYCPLEFYQVLYDSNDTLSGFTNQPIGDSSCLSIFESGQGQDALHEIAFTAQLDRWQLGIVADLYGNEQEDSFTFLADYRDGDIGLGVMAPIGGQPRATIRRYGGDYPGFVRTGGGQTMVGISRYGNTSVDLAYGGRTWYASACRQHGRWTPELRVKASPEETIFTFALGYTKD